MVREKRLVESNQELKSVCQKVGELLVYLSLGYQQVPRKRVGEGLKPFNHSDSIMSRQKLAGVTYKTSLAPKKNVLDIGYVLTVAAADVIQYGCVNSTTDNVRGALQDKDNNPYVMNRLAFLCTAMAGAVPEKGKTESPGCLLYFCRASCVIANLVTLRAPCLLVSRSLENVSAYINFRCYELCEKSVGMVRDSCYDAAYGPMMMGALGVLLGGVTYVASTVIHIITRIVSNVIDFIYNPIETAKHLAKRVDDTLYSVPAANKRNINYVPTTTWPIFKVAFASIAACVAISICAVVPPLLLAVTPNVIAPVAAVVTPVVSAALHTTVSSWTAMAVAGGSLPVLSTLLSGLAKLGGSIFSKPRAQPKNDGISSSLLGL